MRLRHPTPSAWLEVVLGDFDAFMIDHAACERKASATALSFVSHYPDRHQLVTDMLDLAVEELEHFRAVCHKLHERNLVLGPDVRDGYVRRLRGHVRRDTPVYLLDRLLVAGIVEARGFERFVKVADALSAGPLKDFYLDIARSEARHHGLFVRLARAYHDDLVVDARLDELLDIEARVVTELPLLPVVH